MEELRPPVAGDDPRLDAALRVALGPEPVPGPPSPAADALVEEIARVEERARVEGLRAAEEARRRRHLLSAGSGLLFMAVVFGGWAWRAERSRADAESDRADSGWTRAQEEAVRADAGWSLAVEEGGRADAGWSLAAEEGDRADAGWSLAAEEGDRADAGWSLAAQERDRAEAGWSLAQGEGDRADAAEALAVAEERRADQGWARADAETVRADEGWELARIERERVAELARMEAVSALSLSITSALHDAAHARGLGDFEGARGALDAAAGLLADELATPALVEAVRGEVAELEGAVAAEVSRRDRESRGADAVARLELALARAEVDGASAAVRAELLADAFADSGFDPLALPPVAAAASLEEAGRGEALADGLFAWAAAAADAGDPIASQSLVERAVLLSDGPRARTRAASVLLSAGRPAAAAPHLEALCALVPDSRGALETLAGARWAAGDAAGAAQALRDALACGPHEPGGEAGLRGRLGRALRRAGDLPASEAELESAAALAPELTWVALELAATRLAGGDAAGAMATVRGLVGVPE